MKTQARVVVIGGGVVGVSTLYHLVKKGWSDVVLVERTELTAGSTWHAAGLLPLFNMSYSVGQIHKYSVQFYQELEAETGQDVGFRQVGNIRLATHRDRMDEYQQYVGTARTIGVNVHLLTPDEVKALWPLAYIDDLEGAIVHPEDGYIQPADLTQALARGARSGGGEIYRRTRVIGIERTLSNEWRIKTNKGDIVCEHVVSATGNHARELGAMVDLDVPVIPVEHQYIVTEAHPDLEARQGQGLPEMGVLRDSDGSWYLREERGGFILGPYERGAPACFLDGPPHDFENDLFPGDLERLEPHIASAIRRVPAFGEVGVKEVINGPIPYTPDGSPIIGPAWGIKNFWLNEGHSFGITAAGGAGWQLAEWIVDGEPTIDMLGVDPRRYGDYATKAYLQKKNEETYANVFTVHYPDEERSAARPLRTAPCYQRMRDLGAVFGQKFGWERPNWFARTPRRQEDHWSFRRSAWFDAVGEECRNVHENVGLLDMTAFAKSRISGPGAEAFLDYVFANRLPQKSGRIGLCHALNGRGGVHSEFTVHKEGRGSFYCVSAGAYQRLDHDWLQRALPADGSVNFENLTNQIGVLVVAGPKSRELMSRVSDTDYSTDYFPWLLGKEVTVGLAPTKALRVNFVGELGWELHHPIEYQNHIFDALIEAGSDLGLKPFGIRAMDSLRIEKSYRMVGTELSIEYAPYESGLDRFVHLNKGDFIGCDALVRWRESGFSNAFVTMLVDGIDDTDALSNNPIFSTGVLVGRVTSGNYGWRVQRSVALGMVSPEYAKLGAELEIEILGRRHPAQVVGESPFDPDNQRLKE